MKIRFLCMSLCWVAAAAIAMAGQGVRTGTRGGAELSLEEPMPGEYAITLVHSPQGRVDWHASFTIAADNPFDNSQVYRVSFEACASQAANLSFSIKQNNEPWNFVADLDHRTMKWRLDSEWQRYSFAFTAVGSYPADAVGQAFFLGDNPAGTRICIRNFKVEPLSAYTAIDISRQANFGFADEIAGDGKGGWSDQGPSNDFRNFPLGKRRFCQVPFNVLDPGRNGGRAILSFDGAAVRTGMKEASLAIGHPRKYLYLLNAETHAPSKSEVVAQLVFVLPDGSEAIQEVRHGVDTGEWWSPREYGNGALALEERNDLVRIGAYVSKFPVPEGAVEVKLRSTGVSNWIVIAATLADFDFYREPLKVFQYDANHEWRAMTMPVYPAAGSALDLSGCGFPKGNRDRIVSSGGHLAFASAPDVPIRMRGTLYLMHRLFDYPCGMLRDPRGYKVLLEEFTDALLRSGFNMIRLHLMNLGFMKWEKHDIDRMPSTPEEVPFDPAKVDFFHYLVKCCRDRGIYVTLDICGTASMFTDSRPDWEGNSMPGDFKSRLYYDEDYRKNWAAGATWMMRLKNPYTGNALADENTVFLVEFCNEQLFDWSEKTVSALDAQWQAFQRERTGEPGPFPKLNGAVAGEKNALGAAMNLFVMKKELELIKFYEDVVRKAGYKGLCFNFDNGHQISRIGPLAQLDVNSSHPYFSHTEMAGGKRLVAQASHAGVHSGFMGAWRLIDRPFLTTEYNYVFWNQYRHESGLIHPVIAALNGWDGITTHCESLLPTPQPLESFFNAPDPINRAYEVISEYIWKRGYLKANPGSSAFLVTEEELPSGGKSIVHSQYGSILSWLTRTGILYAGPQKGGNEEAAADIYLSPIKGDLRDREANRLQGIGDANELVEILRHKAIIPDDNRSRPRERFFQSGSGEVTVNDNREEISVVAPRIEAMTVKTSEAAALSSLTIQKSSIPALIAVISQDEESIDESRRLLLVIATDAVNSGMRFSSSKRLELESIGKLPVLYRCGKFELGLKSAMKNPVLYALRCDGTRIEEIPLEAGNGRLSIQIDTTVLGEPAVFFELAEKE